MNKLVLIGRLTKDPELRETRNGTKLCCFSIAVKKKYSKDKDADFFDLTAWNGLAETIHTYFKKGQQIAIEGHLEMRKWEKDGKTRNILNIIVENFDFVGDKPNEKDEQKKSPYYGEYYKEEDLPF